jgi:hypothetical protein
MTSPDAHSDRSKPERRKGPDRRQADQGPPGKHDRRLALESRQPEVRVLELANSDWIALLDEPPKT